MRFIEFKEELASQQSLERQSKNDRHARFRGSIQTFNNC
jgi:hypothetical protein